jgi:hypothetical protein
MCARNSSAVWGKTGVLRAITHVTARISQLARALRSSDAFL